MAKSKVGGSRGYIRGKLGADVYSIGKDGAGKKQQVVRSLAEQVKNPQTTAQMRGRMIMSTVMQMVAAGSFLFDHSFDNVPNGQPSISEFIRRNYALIKADVAAHPSNGNIFGLNKYQEKGAKGGMYVISAGTAQVPSTIQQVIELAGIEITPSAMTAKGVRDALDLGLDDYITIVVVDTEGKLDYLRLRVDTTTLPDDSTITNQNADSLFKTEGNAELWAEVSNGKLNVRINGVTAVSVGMILSKKQGASYIHNDAVMDNDYNISFTEAVALPTYPVGSERFLNGGEL